MSNAALQKAIDIAGNQTRLAEKLGEYPQLVQSWTKTRVPAHWVIPIVKAVNGAVSPSDLRPDIFGDPDQDTAA
jgi:DNA-binding transcriptional regulator YdaS (Cro superfamily)